MKRLLVVAFALLLAALPARADFGAGGNLLGFWASSGGITSIAYVPGSATTSTGTNITAPASIEAGDLLILTQWGGQNTSPPSDVTPTDWTDVPTSQSITSGGAGARLSMKYKIADGTEDGSTITGMNAAAVNRKIILLFRANKPITALTVSAAVGDSTSGNPSTQTILASLGTPPVLGVATYALSPSSGTINPRTMSVTEDIEVKSDDNHWIKAYVQNSSPADFTFDMDDEGSINQLLGAYFHSFQD